MDLLADMQTSRGVHEAIQTIPENMNSIYDKLIKQIYSQDTENVRLAEQVLSWISYTVRPLTLTEIHCALAVEPEDLEFDKDSILDKETLESVCHGIVTIEEQSNVIRFSHFTIENYFQRLREIRFPTAQTEIARTCLTCLLFHTLAGGSCQSDEEMEVRLQENPLLVYAAKYWGEHARETSLSLIKQLTFRLFNQPSNLSSAVQAMWLSKGRGIQSFPTGVSGLWISAHFGLTTIV